MICFPAPPIMSNLEAWRNINIYLQNDTLDMSVKSLRPNEEKWQRL